MSWTLPHERRESAASWTRCGTLGTTKRRPNSTARIVAADTVVLRATFRGTDTGGYVGRAPTGRAVNEWVVTIMHFDGDKVVREWVGADKLGMFIQLGVLEDPWPA